MTLAQLKRKFSDYQIVTTQDVVSGKRLYSVVCPDQTTFTANTLKELKSGLEYEN
jgi:hypothetical protein